ncbi:hypothetical protein [Aneurinibacillus tyrosinisolvens]|uniref:hypothetical protein n=1 Tax=Aneurinibacillus tyrosinisolvens TaxID=1443435 RepID=UPI00069ABD2F|nr:hypothetical protein [Aneurinibacillus tyrosinisolvens]
MKKLLTVATTGLAVLAIAGSAFAASTTTSSSTTSTTQQKVSMHKHEKQFNNQELLSLLKVDAATLQQNLKNGKSLADVAAAQGVDEQKVIDLLVNQHAQRLAQAIQDGKLTQEQANQKKADEQTEIKNRVEQKGGFGFGGEHGKHGGERGGFKDAASVLGITEQELQTQLQAGKTLAQIAQDKGIAKDDLINKLLQNEKDRLTKMVDQTWQQHDDAKTDGETNDDASTSDSNTTSTINSQK